MSFLETFELITLLFSCCLGDTSLLPWAFSRFPGNTSPNISLLFFSLILLITHVDDDSKQKLLHQTSDFQSAFLNLWLWDWAFAS